MTDEKIDWESRRDGFGHRRNGVRVPDNAINWIFWGHLPDIKQWEACALSLNINPDGMRHHPQGWMGGPGSGPLFAAESFPSKAAQLEFDSRLLMLNRIAKGNHSATVNPGEFAALCLHLKFEGIPPELVAMAVTPKATEPTDPPPQSTPEQNAGTPVPMAAGGASGGNESWDKKAQIRAHQIIKRDGNKDLYPSQMNIADEIAKEFRQDGVMGADGKPLAGSYIKRHALSGISSARGKQLSTKTRRGK